jgi:hypothetical protein
MMMPSEPRAPEMPAEAPPLAGAAVGGPVAVPRPEFHWSHKLYAVVFVSCCMAVGIFLLVFPWTDYWDTNYFSWLVPAWHRWWDNLYVRGAVSGLGAINLYISLLEAFRLRRFARH